MRFKKWLQNENLAGPGGGPEPEPENQEKVGRELFDRGVGAYPTYELSRNKQKTPTTAYLDPRFAKGMKKFMKAEKSVKDTGSK